MMVLSEAMSTLSEPVIWYGQKVIAQATWRMGMLSTSPSTMMIAAPSAEAAS